MVGPKGFSNGGARPGAGRKTLLEEGRLNDLINNSIAITNQFLNDTSIPLKSRAEIASRVAVKRIPTEIKDPDRIFKTGITLVMPNKTVVDLSNGDTPQSVSE